MDDELERIRKEKLTKLMNDDVPVVGTFPIAELNELDEQTFEGFIGQSGIVVIDLWAAWCAPCRTMEPIMKQLAKEWIGQVLIGKLNIDQYPRIAMKYQVSSIPNFLVFQDGKYLGNVVGAVGKKPFDKLFKQIVSGELNKREGYT
ncbi:MAG: thioredoxin [Candidatus Heimdallarchaeota archaeon]|nr:thioredoxin [Candidatus Heimdallarchaeota archaeon]MCK4770095.1 thioredoxin [Candidatus Heimdallarchaeota archaeon]